jgi:rubrerythrin
MANDASGGTNRTGIRAAKHGAKALEMVDAALVTNAEAVALAAERVRMARQSDELGSVPPPATVRGAMKALAGAIAGTDATVLLDKLGERLAFERTGVRLYDAFLAKVDAFGDGVANREAVEEIRRDERRHMALLVEVVESLGGDPTAQTPSADVVGVLSTGILQVLSDPRTDLTQCLEALLVAELADNDGWLLLAELARAAGLDEIADRLDDALEDERAHLSWVRAEIADRITEEAGLAGQNR